MASFFICVLSDLDCTSVHKRVVLENIRQLSFMISFDGWLRKCTKTIALKLVRIFHCSLQLESLYIDRKCFTSNLQNHMPTIYNNTLLKKFNLCVKLK